MQTTQNYKLKKPEETDVVNIGDLNDNMDTVDDILNQKVDKVSGKGLSTNDYTTDEKNKLEGIAPKANNYVHPSVHPASMITQDATHRFTTDTEKAKWDEIDDVKQSLEKYASITVTGELLNLPGGGDIAVIGEVLSIPLKI